jgi:hypothetical protein
VALAGLTQPQAQTFARIALRHIEREYPQKLDHVMTSAADIRSPRELHPVFHGSFDWHSCVHAHWLLARIVRRFPAIAEAPLIEESFDRRFTEPFIASELRYVRDHRSFERPYGWAWLLKLQAELSMHEGEAGARWAQRLEPLSALLAARLAEYLTASPYPNRTGVHANSAFSMILAHDYAKRRHDAELGRAIADRAGAWFSGDVRYQVREPDGWDFLSPALVEIVLVQRVLRPGDFQAWLACFMPGLDEGAPHALSQPATVPDRADLTAAHLDGLNLSRAWCWRAIAAAAESNRVREHALQAARRHLDASLPHISGEYAGEHWLATYAMLALDGDETGMER